MVTVANVAGMRTVHCVRAVFTALAGVDGITRADVALGRVVIDHSGAATENRIREAIEIAGYEVTSTTHDRRTLPLVV